MYISRWLNDLVQLKHLHITLYIILRRTRSQGRSI